VTKCVKQYRSALAALPLPIDEEQLEAGELEEKVRQGRT
jgi:hypothetical protein